MQNHTHKYIWKVDFTITSPFYLGEAGGGGGGEL